MKYGKDFIYNLSDNIRVKYFEMPKDTLILESTSGAIYFDNNIIQFKLESSGNIYFYDNEGWEIDKTKIDNELIKEILNNYNEEIKEVFIYE